MNISLVLLNQSLVQKISSMFLVALLFLLPMSSSGKSICLAVSLGFILLAPGNLSELRGLLSKTWCQSALLLFSIVLFSCLWSSGSPSERLFAIQKYSKLLYLPILVLGFRDPNARHFGLHAFLFSMLFICGISILKFHGYLQSYLINPDRIFRNHIMTGHFAAFANYLCLLFFYRQKDFLPRMMYGLMALILSYQLIFINIGRTGYVIWGLLIILLVVQQFSWKQIVMIAPLLGVLMGGSYLASPVMKENSHLVLQDVKDYRHDMKDTDVGYRLQFYHYAYALFKRHPLIGNGAGSFVYYFKTENPVPTWHNKALLEPHSQYWLMASEFGIVGLGALTWFFLTLFVAVRPLDRMKFPAMAMLLSFIIGNVSDSLLFYSGSGYFFLIMMALFLGESPSGSSHNKRMQGV